MIPRAAFAISRPAGPTEINGAWLDKYTVAHFSAGALSNLYTKGRVRFWGALAIGVGWEIVEWILKAHVPQWFYPYDGQDSWNNVITDIAAVVAGWWVADKLPEGAWL